MLHWDVHTKARNEADLVLFALKKQQVAEKGIITCLLNGQGNVPSVVSDSDAKKSQRQRSNEH